MSRCDNNEDEDGGRNLFSKLDKITVLQEAKYFNTARVNPKKCVLILSKVVYLLNQGERFSTQEATDVFFAITKLFKSKHVKLRRLVNLCIKELSPIAQDVVIVTSALTKDMTGRKDLYRAAAIRALYSITDNTRLQDIKRYMKRAILDKNPAVSSAALVSALHLSATVPELVQRWLNAAQKAMTSDSGLVSYHALAVVANVRRNDRLSNVKLILKMMRSPHRLSPFALCLLMRHVAKLAEEDPSEASEPYFEFIMSCLRHKSEIVVYEAAYAVVNLRKSEKELAQAVCVLQIFCRSSKTTLRLAGARTLAKLAAKHPSAIAACAVDLENLINDPNRSVATFAVTALLATGAESSIDRLMEQISSFMSEISDELKIVVVQAIKRLCSKYPHKHPSLAMFLAGMLREEGGVQYKSEIADGIISLVEENPDAKETGLAHLCEYIEDCEHSSLAVRILHVLGHEGPKASQPSRYIRYIYNRVLLDSSPVRAAAVSAVARFGAARPELHPNVMEILARCQLDDEDEVRDRAVYYSAILESGNGQLINDYIIDVQVPNPILLEKALANHLSTSPDEPFSIAIYLTEAPVEKPAITEPTLSLKEKLRMEVVKANSQTDEYGPIFKSCEAIDLIEPGMEIKVQCVKYVFAHHLVLQYKCMNTVMDQVLEKVNVRIEPPAGYIHLCNVPCRQLPYNITDSVYHLFEFPANAIEALGKFRSTLEYTVRDCNPDTGVPVRYNGYPDSYWLERFELECADQLRMHAAASDWEEIWALGGTAGCTSEACDTFALLQTDVGEAAKAVCGHLAMPMESVSGDAVKEIRGGGLWRTGVLVFLRARLVAAQGSVTMQLTVRSTDEETAAVLLAHICVSLKNDLF